MLASIATWILPLVLVCIVLAAVLWCQIPPVFRLLIKQLCRALCCGRRVMEAQQMGNVLAIPFNFQGNTSCVYVPYDTSDTFKYTGVRVFLTPENKEEKSVEITQMPGIPYVVRAQDFGFSAAEVISSEGVSQRFSSLDYIVIN